MKARFLGTLSFFTASCCFAQLPYTQEQVIAYSKSIDVHTLDSLLPHQGLENWLQTGPPHAQIHWTVADTCDLKPDDPDTDDYPLCAKILVGRGGENGQFLVQVGTLRSGIVGVPKLYQGIFVYESMFVITSASDRLSDLPALLDQPAVTGNVEKLYSVIVARHPIGIPSATEMTAIRPFLSKRLAAEIQTAQACQDDYRRQHPGASETAKPGWLRSGLFSGDDSHASPVYAIVDRKEKLNDRSFQVYLNLEPLEAVINLGHGQIAFHGGYTWQVVVRVFSEEGKFVVDDVRVFDNFPAEGPSRVLSDSFTGCDGARWIGLPRAHN